MENAKTSPHSYLYAMELTKFATEMEAGSGRRRKEYDATTENLPIITPEVVMPSETIGTGRHRKVGLVDSKITPLDKPEVHYIGRHRKETLRSRSSTRLKAIGAAAITAIGLFTVASPDTNENTAANQSVIEAGRMDILAPTSKDNTPKTEIKRDPTTKAETAQKNESNEAAIIPEIEMRAPYTLEKFGIAVLENLAKHNNVPRDNVVTKEHLIGLIAFMKGEGGDINNRWEWNPLNSGLNRPELVDGPARANGTQSFKSFEAGVNATAGTMDGRYQKLEGRPVTQDRLAQVLFKQHTDAEDFMWALTYYKSYEGNKAWAEQSMEPWENPYGQGQDKYFRERLALVENVRKNYEDVAGLIIGTQAEEEVEGIKAQTIIKP